MTPAASGSLRSATDAVFARAGGWFGNGPKLSWPVLQCRRRDNPSVSCDSDVPCSWRDATRGRLGRAGDSKPVVPFQSRPDSARGPRFTIEQVSVTDRLRLESVDFVPRFDIVL